LAAPLKGNAKNFLDSHNGAKPLEVGLCVLIFLERVWRSKRTRRRKAAAEGQVVPVARRAEGTAEINMLVSLNAREQHRY
jgi:hypothetical protein